MRPLSRSQNPSLFRYFNVQVHTEESWEPLLVIYGVGVLILFGLCSEEALASRACKHRAEKKKMQMNSIDQTGVQNWYSILGSAAPIRGFGRARQVAAFPYCSR